MLTVVCARGILHGDREAVLAVAEVVVLGFESGLCEAVYDRDVVDGVDDVERLCAPRRGSLGKVGACDSSCVKMKVRRADDSVVVVVPCEVMTLLPLGHARM